MTNGEFRGFERAVPAMAIVDGELKFPSAAEVVAEEAARFRAATPAERMRAIRSVLSGGAALIAKSPKRAFLEAYRQRQEDLAREVIARFVVRHGRSP